jgi:hypothetical protein
MSWHQAIRKNNDARFALEALGEEELESLIILMGQENCALLHTSIVDVIDPAL